MTLLHRAQAAALAHVTKYARARADAARTTLAEICEMSNLSADARARCVDNIKQHARIALHFHPDRPDAQLRTVGEDVERA